jgi:hypothetical protein
VLDANSNQAATLDPQGNLSVSVIDPKNQAPGSVDAW